MLTRPKCRNCSKHSAWFRSGLCRACSREPSCVVRQPTEADLGVMEDFMDAVEERNYEQTKGKLATYGEAGRE